MILNSEVSARINLLRFPLIVGVVLIHTFHQGNGVFFGDSVITYNGDFISIFVQFLFSEVLARTSVPLFFLISGILFFKDFSLNRECYRKKVKSRVSSILMPYLFWNSVIILLRFLAEFLPNSSVLFSGRNKLVSDYSFVDILSDFFWSPASYQFWFLRDLFIVILLSPLFFMAAKKIGVALFFMFVATWLLDAPRFVLNLDWQAPTFFYLACLIKVRNWRLNSFNRKSSLIIASYGFFAIIVASSYTILFLRGQEFILMDMFAKLVILLGIMAVWCSTQFMLNTKFQKILLGLAPFSFFVYAAHEPMMTVVRKVVYRLFPPSSSLEVIIYYFLLPTAVISFLVVFAVCLKNLLPKVYALATGGRVSQKIAESPNT